MTPEMLREPGLRGSAEDRFWQYANKGDLDDCWIWTGAVSSRGYGRLQTPHSNSTPAHRVSYVLHTGPIPEGMVVDHICRERLCVNPAHLRAVDPKTNTLENSVAVTAINASKITCLKGHPLSGPNLKIKRRKDRTERVCRTCEAVYRREHYRRTHNVPQERYLPLRFALQAKETK